jgi:8-oxoguanine deaminase
MRLASGIAPVPAMLAQGVPVGLGVDGSASNDSSHMLAEARIALLLQRVLGNPAGLSGSEALWLATRGGASVLRRDEIGQLSPGKAADFVAFDLNQPAYSGAAHDPVNALTLCAPQQVILSVINGRIVVEDGYLRTINLAPTNARHRQISTRLIRNE